MAAAHKTVIVTGASQGIGAGIVRAFLARGYNSVPNTHVHILDAGHFALDTKADEIAALVREFMK